MPWTNESLEELFRKREWDFEPRKIQDGMQYLLGEAVRVNLYSTTGRTLVQGPASALKTDVESALNGGTTSIIRTPTNRPAPSTSAIIPGAKEHKIFIVYGHDQECRDQLELMLLRLGFKPVILDQLPPSGDTIIEKLEDVTDADFACVLLTPDDEGKSISAPGPLHKRARQNVVLELGMVLTKLGRKRVAILIKGEDLEKPSDIAGLIYLPFKKDVTEIRDKLAATLSSVGFPIDPTKLI